MHENMHINKNNEGFYLSFCFIGNYMVLYRYVVGFLILFFLVGCEGNATKPNERTLRTKSEHNNQKVDSGRIDGKVIIMQDAALSENAKITVTLADTSMIDLPALILSQKYYSSQGNQPFIPFVLTYHKNEIRPDAKITISASVHSEGKLLYISNTVIEVINNGVTEDVDVLVVPAN